MTRHMIRTASSGGSGDTLLSALSISASISPCVAPSGTSISAYSSQWVGVKPVPAPARWVLGDLTRFEYDDDFWYSDGWAAVREGAPVPTERLDPVSPATGEQYAKWLRERLAWKPQPPHLPTFHARYRALLEHADERRWCGQFLALLRGGKVFAVVGPNYAGTLDECGREVSP